jgi:hypothetical protein
VLLGAAEWGGFEMGGQEREKTRIVCTAAGYREWDTMCNLGAINSDREQTLKCKIYCFILIITTQLKMQSMVVNFHPLTVYNRIRRIIRTLF